MIIAALLVLIVLCVAVVLVFEVKRTHNGSYYAGVSYGYDAGYDDGYDEGYDDGRPAGYDVGFLDGYEQNFTDMKALAAANGGEVEVHFPV